MYEDSSSPLPQHTSSVDLADRFNDFFAENVQTIRDTLPTQKRGGAKFCSPAECDSVAACLETLESVNSIVVGKVISRMKFDAVSAGLLSR